MPGESSAAAASAAASNMASAASVSTSMESRSLLLRKCFKTTPINKIVVHSVPVEVEHIDIGEPESPGLKPTKRSINYRLASQIPFSLSSDPKIDEQEENIDIHDEDIPTKTVIRIQGEAAPYDGFDINIPTHNDTDDEITEVDVNDDEARKGPNAAEALKAQVDTEYNDDDDGLSSSGSSGSRSSGSGSRSGSSNNYGSDDDSASSGGELDI